MAKPPDPKEKFRAIIEKSRKTIRQYVIMLVGLYIGFILMTQFLGVDKSLLSIIISFGLAFIILATLMYTVIEIKTGRKFLEQQDTK